MNPIRKIYHKLLLNLFESEYFGLTPNNRLKIAGYNTERSERGQLFEVLIYFFVMQF